MQHDELNLQKVCRYGKKSYGLRMLATDLPKGTRSLEIYSKIFYVDMYKYFVYNDELENRIQKFEKKTGFHFVVKDSYESMDEMLQAELFVVEFEVKPFPPAIRKSIVKRFFRKLVD